MRTLGTESWTRHHAEKSLPAGPPATLRTGSGTQRAPPHSPADSKAFLNKPCRQGPRTHTRRKLPVTTELSDLLEPTHDHGLRPTPVQEPLRRWNPHCAVVGQLSEGFITVPDGRLGARPRWGPTRTGNQATGLPLQVPDVGKEHGATRQPRGREGSDDLPRKPGQPGSRGLWAQRAFRTSPSPLAPSQE